MEITIYLYRRLLDMNFSYSHQSYIMCTLRCELYQTAMSKDLIERPFVPRPSSEKKSLFPEFGAVVTLFF